MPAASPIEAMLAGLRRAFLDELPTRCDDIENLILRLEDAKDHQESFDELYRRVHSLKGSGGTHGLYALTHLYQDSRRFPCFSLTDTPPAQ